MAKIVARNASLYVEDSSGTMRTVSGLLNSISFSYTAEAPDTTSFGAVTRERLPAGLKDWELSFSAFFSSGANEVDEIMSGILGGSSSFQFGPSGSTSTCTQYTACSILTDYSMDFGVADAATVSGTLIGRSGSLTRGSWT